MKTTKRFWVFALLLAPAVTWADMVSIDWTGQIDAYGSVGSGFPSDPLLDTHISGVIDLDLNLLPAPDPGNPSGVVSFTGTDFLHSSAHWVGGTFQPHLPGGALSDSLYLDLLQGQSAITDSSTYIDGLGVAHQALLSLNLTGSLPTMPGQTPGNLTGSGTFADVSADGQGGISEGFIGQFQLDYVSVAVGPTVGVPEPDMMSLSVLMLLALTVALFRRRRAHLA
jgi:hypothetical protein